METMFENIPNYLSDNKNQTLKKYIQQKKQMIDFFYQQIQKYQDEILWSSFHFLYNHPHPTINKIAAMNPNRLNSISFEIVVSIALLFYTKLARMQQLKNDK
jgi:AAA15 family ATPase/GTPase